MLIFIDLIKDNIGDEIQIYDCLIIKVNTMSKNHLKLHDTPDLQI
jgi:hypothetical protein